MDLTAVVRSYVERMLKEVSGMKVLLLAVVLCLVLHRYEIQQQCDASSSA